MGSVITQFHFQCVHVHTCCSHDLEATDILPIIIDGVSNNIRSTAAAPRLPFCPMAYKTTASVRDQYIPRVGPSVTLDCATGWILRRCCHGEHYNNYYNESYGFISCSCRT